MSYPTSDSDTRDRDHLTMLAIGHFILAGLVLLGIGGLFLHYTIMQTVFRNPALFQGQNAPPMAPESILHMMVGFYVFAGALMVLASGLNLASGFFILRRKFRIYSIVIGALDCFMIPLGTVLGVFTILVLSRDSVQGCYQPVSPPRG